MRVTKPGMIIWVAEDEDGNEYEYEANDAQCVAMLAAEDHGGEPEDYTVRESAA